MPKRTEEAKYPEFVYVRRHDAESGANGWLECELAPENIGEDDDEESVAVYKLVDIGRVTRTTVFTPDASLER